MSYDPINSIEPSAPVPHTPTRFVVATTMAAFVMDQEHTWKAWLYSARKMIDIAILNGDELHFFAALQLDARGLEPFKPLIRELQDLVWAGKEIANIHVDYWTYTLDDGRTEVTTANRLRHLTAGQNFANDHAQAVGADYLLFMAADCMPPADAPWELAKAIRASGAHVMGGEVPTYCLNGREVDFGQEYPLQEHMPTAAFVMLKREAFRLLRWRWDSDLGMTDDPCLYADAKARGWKVYVRKDVIGKHYPEAIGPIETRGHDMKVVR